MSVMTPLQSRRFPAALQQQQQQQQYTSRQPKIISVVKGAELSAALFNGNTGSSAKSIPCFRFLNTCLVCGEYFLFNDLGLPNLQTAVN